MKPVLPGATLGVLGSGQLGRMFALAARRMGYRVHTFSPDSDTPTGQVADLEVTAPYEDLDAVRRFASACEVITFEFENVPAATASAAAELTLVRPSGEVLHTTQNRLREKNFLSRQGFPVAAYAPVASAEDLPAALARVGRPAVLKTAGFGYDGKGQRKVETGSEAASALAALGGREAILEEFVAFECELSVVAARGGAGEFAHYGVIENEHARHILDVSVAPAPHVNQQVAREAVEIARGVLEALDVVGVMCVEMFLAPGGRLLVNELAPRPHNSGHLTIEACVTSQFEQQLRAACGLALGATDFARPAAAMANLLGDLWERGEPDWPAALSTPGVALHLYGKREARPGRKMGHLTATAATPAEAARLVRAAREALQVDSSR